eukprot:4992187-Pleurochrysis_carterae.AAC.1
MKEREAGKKQQSAASRLRHPEVAVPLIDVEAAPCARAADEERWPGATAQHRANQRKGMGRGAGVV